MLACARVCVGVCSSVRACDRVLILYHLFVKKSLVYTRLHEFGNRLICRK